MGGIMSMSVDVLMFDWDIIVDQIVNNGCDNRHVVEEVLQMYGEKICDKYVVLIDEHREQDAFSSMCSSIESLFDVEDCFDTIYKLDFEYIGGDYSDKSRERCGELRKLAELLESER